MQIKINFLCRDSILAAPLVLDIALFMDLAQRAGVAGHPGVDVLLLQEPHGRTRALPVEHDLFIQLTKLKNTLRVVAGEEPITHLGLDYYGDDLPLATLRTPCVHVARHRSGGGPPRVRGRHRSAPVGARRGGPAARWCWPGPAPGPRRFLRGGFPLWLTGMLLDSQALWLGLRGTIHTGDLWALEKRALSGARAALTGRRCVANPTTRRWTCCVGLPTRRTSSSSSPSLLFFFFVKHPPLRVAVLGVPRGQRHRRESSTCSTRRPRPGTCSSTGPAPRT